MNDNKEVAIKKYNAIAKANKSMFITVMVASVVVSASVVLTIFLAQKIAFRTKIIGVQSKTLQAIDQSSKNIEELKSRVKGLQTNDELLTSKANPEDNALRVVLDSLPSEANAEAIGSSLSARILNVSGLTVENMRVEPIMDSGEDSASVTPVGSEVSNSEEVALSPRVKTAEFSFTVTAQPSEGEGSKSPQEVLVELLRRIEKSIRTFSVSSFKFDTNKNGSMTLTVSGQAYYLPEYTLQLTKQTIQSSEGAKSSAGNTTSNNTGGAQ